MLKGTNFCPDGNPLCGAGPHFDIAAPGFDVLAYSFAHTCPEREPEEAAGELLSKMIFLEYDESLIFIQLFYLSPDFIT